MQELDIRSIMSALWSKINWIIIATVVFAVAFGGYSKLFVKSTYRSEVQIYVSNQNDISNSTGASTGGLSASQQLVNTYIVILQHDSVTTKIAAQLREQGDGYVMKNAAIHKAVKMSSVGETSMLKITATTTDPNMSKAICDSYLAVAPSELKDVTEIGTIKPMGTEAKPGVKVGPNVLRNAIFGALIGFVLSCLLVLVLYMLDNTVTGERELKRRLDVTVLGEVPSLDGNMKGAKKNAAGK